MSEHVYWIIEAQVSDGKLDELKELMVDMSNSTKENEPGALNYEWSLSDDEQTCHILERYENSDAAMVHMGNFGSKFAKRFMGVLKPTRCTLYGNPNESVCKAMAPMGYVKMTSVAGFSR